ncbi:PP2C family protein-serine/threonine phosphatase [Pseudomonas sp. Marseille-QA0892]
MLRSRWQSAARTDTGKVRARNEDAVLDCPNQGLWAAADGMGGHQNGALASRLIVEYLAEPLDGNLDARVHETRQRLHAVNRCLERDITLQAWREDALVGSTVVALLAEGRRATCIWAGDSRCYLWRNNCLYLLTRDHCLMQHLMDNNGLTEDQALRHPGAHALTRAVGANEHLELDLLELETQPGDTFLLCTDGLYRSLNQAEMGEALSLKSPAAALRQLFDRALQGPARDNLGAVVVRL